MECRHTSLIVEYQDRFETLLSCAGTLVEAKKMQLFTIGLQPPLSLDVMIHNS
jgi:hypothetical protein